MRQVEFESAKHEARRLLEEVDVLNGQLEEQTALRRIAEKQMEEALEALQVITAGRCVLTGIITSRRNCTVAWLKNYCDLDINEGKCIVFIISYTRVSK